MRLPTCLAALVLVAPMPLLAQSGGPTAPVDVTERSGRFSPAPGGTTVRELPRLPGPAERRAPEAQRIEPWIRERESAAIQDDRAPIDLKETREKNLRPLERFERHEIPRQAATVNQRDVAERFDPAGQRKVYPNADRYNTALRSATIATTKQTAHTQERTGFADMNRFVFRRSRATTPGDAVPARAAGEVLAPAGESTSRAPVRP